MGSHLDEPQRLTAEGISVSLTQFPLDIPSILDSVKSPKAGAVVLFAGNFSSSEPSTGVFLTNLNRDH